MSELDLRARIPSVSVACAVAVFLCWMTLAVVIGSPARSASAALTFTPVVDTYVNKAYPNTSYGRATSLYVDARSVKQSFLRFEVAGIEGRTVTGVTLRLYQKGASPLGGRVFEVSSRSWTEATTWNTRPAIDGPLLGSFGAVTKNTWHDLNLGAFIANDGEINLAIDSTSSDGAKWGSSDGAYDPRLIVNVDSSAPPPPPSGETDGLTTVVSAETGSSDPTYYASNKRIAMTAGGRQLVIHGKHATGVQLAWRDPGQGWQNRTTGSVSDGLLLGGTGTGDWPASIVTELDGSGAEHAWVVWGGAGENEIRPIQMRRLSNLDDPAGPSVGPLVTIAAADRVNDRPDLAFETAPDGVKTGLVTWVRKNSDTSYDLMVTSFGDLGTATPTFSSPTSLIHSTNSNITPTVVATPGGAAIVARAEGYLRTYVHEAGASVSAWSGGAAGISASYKARPGAVALDHGVMLGAVETKTTEHVVKVQRFTPTGVPSSVDLQVTGYAQPSIATDGTRAWLVMVRVSDGFVVSRAFDGETWTAADRVEIGAEGGGNHGYANVLRRTDGRLRFVVRGPAASSYRSAALAYQRLL